MAVTISSSLPVALVSGTGVTFSAPVVNLISTDDVYDVANPTQTLTELLAAISSEQLIGSANVDGTIVGNTTIYTVPAGQKFAPTSVLFALTGVGGSGNAPSINLGFTGTAYSEIIDSTRSTLYDLISAAPFAGGSGYANADVLTLSGGVVVSSAYATVAVASTYLTSLALNAPGTIYAPGDTVTLAGGVPVTRAIITVSTVKLVSATIHSGGGGTGYDGGSPSTFNVTVVGGTHSVVATVNVTTDGTGVVNTINSVSAAGNYTGLPTLSGNMATGDDGSNHGVGLSLDLVFGINTFAITTPGDYTTNTATFTQFATSHSGSGATFQTALYGVLTVTVDSAGNYITFPTGHLSVSGGGGAGATIDAGWAVTESLFSNITNTEQLLNITDITAVAGSSGAGYQYLTGGEVLTLRVNFASTYSTYNLKVFVFGFSFS